MAAPLAPHGDSFAFVRRALRRRALQGTGFRQAIVVTCALWLGVAYGGTKPRMSGDQRVWLDGAYGRGFFEVVLGKRPPLTPWLHQLAGFDNERVVWLQLGLQLAAMALFASELAAFAKRRWTGNLAFTACLAWLVLDSNDWAFVVRSEALAHSCLLAFFAGLLGALRSSLHERRGVARLYACGALLFALAGLSTRDTIAYVLMASGLAVPILLATARRSWRVEVTSALLSVSLFSAGALGTRLTELSGRQLTPLDNLLVGRVFTNPSRTAYFKTELGLPWSDALARYAKARHQRHSAATAELPGIEAYHSWLAERGSSAYRSYLWNNLGASVALAGRRYGSLLRADFRDEYLGIPRHAGLAGARHALRLVDPSVRLPNVWPWLVIVVTAASLASRRRDTRLLGAATLGVVVLSWIIAFVVVHGDAMEVERHGALVGVLVRNVATPLAVACVLVWFRRRMRARILRSQAWSPRLRSLDYALAGLGLALCAAGTALALGAHGTAARPNIARTSIQRGLDAVPATLFDDDLDHATTCLRHGQKLVLTFPRPVADFYVFRGTAHPLEPGLEVRWLDVHDKPLGNAKPGSRAWPNPRVLQVDGGRPRTQIEVRANEGEQCLAEIRAY